MRAGLALALALIALIAVAASATAEPPTPLEPYSGQLRPVTLRVSSPASEALRPAPPSPSVPPPAALVDPGTAPVPTLGPRRQPAPDKGILVKPTPTPRPAPPLAASAPRATGGGGGGGGGGGHVLRGRASWYCNRDGSRAQLSPCHYRYPDTAGFNAYAAAGPRLRAALGAGWRGRVVSVNGIRVRLVDWCQCYKGEPHEKIIDLYYDVFRRVGGNVTIRW